MKFSLDKISRTMLENNRKIFLAKLNTQLITLLAQTRDWWLLRDSICASFNYWKVEEESWSLEFPRHVLNYLSCHLINARFRVTLKISLQFTTVIFIYNLPRCLFRSPWIFETESSSLMANFFLSQSDRIRISNIEDRRNLFICKWQIVKTINLI